MEFLRGSRKLCAFSLAESLFLIGTCDEFLFPIGPTALENFMGEPLTIS